jgi:hypothetical protein
MALSASELTHSSYVYSSGGGLARSLIWRPALIIMQRSGSWQLR